MIGVVHGRHKRNDEQTDDQSGPHFGHTQLLAELA
jgi:hypothetical protein